MASTVHGTTVNLTNDWFRFETWRSMEMFLYLPTERRSRYVTLPW